MEQFPCISPHFAQNLHTTDQFQTLELPHLSHNPCYLSTKLSDMSTPYTLTRCRMKDLISCFNACKVQIEEDTNELDHPEPIASSIVNDRNFERDENTKTATTPEKGGGEESPASCQSCESEEDDYIVFYFKDDNAGGDVIEERRLESSSERKREIAGGIRRKIDQRIQNEWTGSPVLMPRPDGYKKPEGSELELALQWTPKQD
ncbi:hypothetical protein E3N88_20942 [Mikania micrantha]|uniref:Uncharacterized protein n=1 Tax=Mikania micrantha TaxID=192012 RepID=A0A5N6NJU4_9ASTR|nr:hypothetical protein E3N88_20942 [Mikania micrantha]